MKELLEKYGQPKTYIEGLNNWDKDYVIDDFKDIDWDLDMPLDDFLPEPDDKSSIAYDLEVYSVKDNLKELYFWNKTLRHKLIGNKLHFYHLTTQEGLLCVHTGIIGEQENIEVVLDEYAPFTYDSLKEKNIQDGYSNKYKKSYAIYFKGRENHDGWKETIKQFGLELLWNGLGMAGGGFFLINEGIYEDWFYAVDEARALKLLLDLGEQNNAKGKIAIYRNKEDNLSSYYDEDRVLIYEN